MTGTVLTAPPAVPTAPISLRTLVRVELGKATDTRAARWLLGLTAAATVLLMLAPLLAPGEIGQDQTTYLQFTALALAALLPVVGILTMTAEWSQRTVLSTFVQEPRRDRVVLAKVAATTLLGVAAVVVGAVVTAVAVAIAEAGGRDIAANLDVGDITGYVLYILVSMAMGVALGALLQNTPAAIVAFFLVPIVLGIVGSFAGPVTRWIDPGTTFTWLLDGDWSGHGARVAVSAALWVLAPLAAGVVRTTRREIS